MTDKPKMKKPGSGPKPKGWPTYEEARLLARAREIPSREEYFRWHDREKIQFLPRRPNRVYEDRGTWVSWNDYLGNTNSFGQRWCTVDYWSYWDAVRFAQASGCKTIDAWRAHHEAGNVPAGVPKYPETVYNEWNDYGTWLGKTAIDVIEAKEGTVPLWVMLHTAGEPANLIWLIKVGSEQDLQTRLNEGWTILRKWAFESDLHDQFWHIVQSQTLEQFGDPEHRLCHNLNQLRFDLDSILLIQK